MRKSIQIVFCFIVFSFVSSADAVKLELFLQGLENPVLLTSANDGLQRLFVVEKTGKIFSFNKEGKNKKLYLDASSLITTRGNEQGLLSLAFHPNFSENGYLYIYYTASNKDNTLARLTARPPYAESVTLDTLEVLFAEEDPASNHNGGMLTFSLDGYLYLGMGDGGKGGDPWDNAQNLQTLLGKMLRIDVNQPQGYSIPGDNPFVNVQNVRPEIWAYGLRNPWRHSVDAVTGDIWIADVGQNKWEEIHFQAATSRGGENYGWRFMEGSHCFKPKKKCKKASKVKLVEPVAEYSHKLGCSVTGGYVYRGAKISQLQGKYIFGDYCTGTIWIIDKENNFHMQELFKTKMNISSFGIDDENELYVLDYKGSIFKLKK